MGSAGDNDVTALASLPEIIARKDALESTVAFAEAAVVVAFTFVFGDTVDAILGVDVASSAGSEVIVTSSVTPV